MELINKNLILPTQNKTDFKKSVRHEKENKDLNLSRKIETSEIISSSNAKMRDPQENENRTGSHKDISVSLVILWRHATGPGIFKNDQAQVKTRPGSTTDGIIDYIKPTIRQKPDIFVIHSKTNDLTKDVSTLSRNRKIVAAVNPAGNYMFKVNNRNTRTRCEICSKLTNLTLNIFHTLF